MTKRKMQKMNLNSNMCIVIFNTYIRKNLVYMVTFHVCREKEGTI